MLLDLIKYFFVSIFVFLRPELLVKHVTHVELLQLLNKVADETEVELSLWHDLAVWSLNILDDWLRVINNSLKPSNSQ